MQRFVRILTAAYAVLLTWLLLAPAPLIFLGETGTAIDDAASVTLGDRIEHAGAYAVLTALLLAAWGSPARTRWLILMAGAHAVVSEFLQQWIPNREGTWQDVAANFTGIAGAVLIALALPVLRRFRDRRGVAHQLGEEAC
jgi:VanZ family protein